MAESVADGAPNCPFCGSTDVTRELAFGSALSKSQYACGDCDTVFERIRWEARRPREAGGGE
jgi:transposase-like protein